MEKRTKDLLVLAVLAFLVLVSLTQAVQLTVLKSEVKSGSLSVSSGSGAAVGSGQLQNSLDSLPGMVGGC